MGECWHFHSIYDPQQWYNVPKLWQRKTNSFLTPGFQHATKTDRCPFSILHSHSVNDKSICNTLFSRQSLFLFVYFHVGTQAQSTASQSPQILSESKLVEISKAANRKWETRNTMVKRQNKWAPSCRTLNKNEQWLIQMGNRQREGKNETEIVHQLPKCHQAVIETLAESKLWREKKKKKKKPLHSLFIISSTSWSHMFFWAGAICIFAIWRSYF